jgi:metallo-beta-lactamase family protein
LAALAVYREAARAGDPEVAPEICAQAAAGIDPFDPGTLVELPSASESAAINSPSEPAIIVSASGMASGGRIVHHLDALLPDERNTVLLVGFQAAGTRGARLLAGEPALKMFGRYVPVRSEVVDATGLSAHADADGLVAWLADLPDQPSTVYVVHGEEEQSAGLAHRIRTDLGWTAVAPTLGERVLI